jgi:hypothetical protein
MSQPRRFDPQHEDPSPSRRERSPGVFCAATARWAVWARWWTGRWRSWQAIIRLLPVAGRVTVAAIMLNLVIGVLPLGFVVGTSEAIGRVAGAGKSVWA